MVLFMGLIASVFGVGQQPLLPKTAAPVAAAASKVSNVNLIQHLIDLKVSKMVLETCM
jgi:hypothetical protein